MESNLVTEKRKYPRFNVDLPVKYRRTTLSTKDGRAVNASEGGLLVHLPEEMDVGQHLKLQIFLPSRPELDTIEAFVQVVWGDIHVRKDLAWDYRTGVKFVDISPMDRIKLKSFLKGLKPKPTYTS